MYLSKQKRVNVDFLQIVEGRIYIHNGRGSGKEMKEYIAFDIGGTQIKYGIVSEIGRVLKRQTVATEIHLGGEQIIQKLIYVSKK